MYKKSNTAAVAAYITWIGWIIAFLIRDKTDGFVAHHLNQALVINLLKIAGVDMSGPDPICKAMDKFNELLDEFEGLVNAK